MCIFIYIHILFIASSLICSDHEILHGNPQPPTTTTMTGIGGAASANSFEVGRTRAFDRSVDCKRHFSLRRLFFVAELPETRGWGKTQKYFGICFLGMSVGKWCFFFNIFFGGILDNDFFYMFIVKTGVLTQTCVVVMVIMGGEEDNQNKDSRHKLRFVTSPSGKVKV